jgi:hypothetical protein
MIKCLLTSFLTIFLVINLIGQTDSKLKGDDAILILDLLKEKINSEYVITKKVSLINSSLNEFEKNHEQLIWDTEEFVNQVNLVLYKASKDHHLKLIYNPESFAAFRKGGQKTADSLNFEKFRKINFGIKKVEILSNNIGYLRLNKFEKREHVESVITGAMLLLANSDAVIIDLRINGGGDGRTKELIESFLMSKEDFFNRSIQEFINTEEFDSLKNANPSCKMLEEIPLYVLTGQGTFSASEGFCYDLQENKRATIVGAKTRGGGHSGSSIPLMKGFLAFIPNSGKGSPVEGIGITPDIEVNERNALLYAQKNIVRQFINSNKDNSLDTQYNWNLETIEACLNNKNIVDSNNYYIGNYTKGFEVYKTDDNLFIRQEKSNMNSKLLPINTSYFVLSDNLDFGQGNYRILFQEGGRATLKVNLGVKIAEMEIEREN